MTTYAVAPAAPAAPTVAPSLRRTQTPPMPTRALACFWRGVPANGTRVPTAGFVATTGIAGVLSDHVDAKQAGPPRGTTG